MMKIRIVCLMAMLICSCRQVDDDSPSASGRESGTMTRDGETQRIVRQHFADYAGHEFEVRGPLTVSQVEHDLVAGDGDQSEANGKEVAPQPSLLESEDWKEFMRRYKRGDDLYYFKSDKRSWVELHGIEGYVVVHNDKVTGVLVTRVN